MMEKLLLSSITKASESPWATANVILPKKDGTMRCTTDFRSLNVLTEADQQHMEVVRETLHWLVECRDELPPHATVSFKKEHEDMNGYSLQLEKSV